MIGVVNIGTMVAYWLVKKADRWGRRRVLMITIAGYTVFTFLTGLSQDIVSFTFFQFMARIFLIGEWAVSMVYAVGHGVAIPHARLPKLEATRILFARTKSGVSSHAPDKEPVRLFFPAEVNEILRAADVTLGALPDAG